jgi:parallel beta-helix repeat protein
VVDKYAPGTAFILGSGTHYGQTIQARSGDQFYGESGTVLDGNGAAKAFAGQGVSNVTVAGITFTDYAPPGAGIGILGTDSGSVGWKVLGNEFHHITRGPVLMLGTSMLVKDNSFHDNTSNAISSWNIRDSIIQNNEFDNNHLSGESPFTTTGYGAAVKIVQSTNTKILNNYVHDTVAGPGIWTDINCDQSLIDGNLVERNGAGGIFLELDYGAVVRNNTVVDNNTPFFEGFQGGGIFVSNAQDANIYNNTFSNNGGAVYVYETNRGSGTQGAWITANVYVHDNTVLADEGLNGVGGTAVNDTTVRFSSNDYNLSGSAKFYYGGAISTSQWQARGYDTAASGATFGASLPTTPTPAPTPAALSYGSGPDTLVLEISQDAYQDSAQYTVSVDGVKQGGTFTASAWHSAGQSDTLTIKGDWAVGTHNVTVNFLNDAWGGSGTTDRNLYLDAMSYNGTAVSGGSAGFFVSGTKSFSFTDVAATGQYTSGTTGADRLVGTAGSDVILGRAGNDTMTGGAGADDFYISPNAGFDRITDFQTGSDDIVFRNITASQVTTKLATYGGVSGLDIFYMSGAGNHVFLENVTKVAAGDFIFA